MLLAIDIGNSNIVLGVYDHDKLIDSFRLEANHARTEDEFATQIINCLELGEIDYHKVSGMIISSTKLAINPIFDKLAAKYFKIKPIFVNSKLKSGIKIKIDDPKSLAPDILVGIVSAYQKYGSEILVIDMGTATTMTILNSDLEYIGGIIFTGLRTSVSALADNTSSLPHIDLDVPNHVICKETVSAMQAGLLYGYAGMIDSLIRKMNKEYQKPLKVILTGGLGNIIHNLLEEEVILDDNLLLDGLNYLYYKNKK